MTTMEMLKRQPRNISVSYDTWIESAEEISRKKGSAGEQIADLLINACCYGVIMGKRMERARRKRSKQ